MWQFVGGMISGSGIVLGLWIWWIGTWIAKKEAIYAEIGFQVSTQVASVPLTEKQIEALNIRVRLARAVDDALEGAEEAP